MCIHTTEKPIAPGKSLVRIYGETLIKEYETVAPDSKLNYLIREVWLKDAILGELWRTLNELEPSNPSKEELDKAIGAELQCWEDMGAWNVVPRESVIARFQQQLNSRAERLRNQAANEWAKRMAEAVMAAPEGQRVFSRPPARPKDE
jgi:hypothetical protein